MERPDVEGQIPETAPAGGEGRHVNPPRTGLEPTPEREKLLAQIRRLEAELGRYRAHAERTSKLFLSVTNYTEWVRENARRDAELVLRKARSKVEKLEYSARELERTKRELVSQQDELARLQALTDETRTRLSAFLTAGLRALNTETDGGGQGDSAKLALGDLQDTLERQLPSTSAQMPERLAGIERQER